MESVMLVLSRKCHEAVVVGGPGGIEQVLKVTVLGIGHGRVRLGFEVADDVPVHRSEVWERIRAGVKGLPSLGLLDAPTEVSAALVAG
jgi:carbon storage regulator CsrA